MEMAIHVFRPTGMVRSTHLQLFIGLIYHFAQGRIEDGHYDWSRQ
jgi:hypothetical protein